MEMKKIVFSTALFSVAFVAQAFNPIIAEPTRPYEPIVLEGAAYEEHQFLGDLNAYPEMYQLSSEVAFDLKVNLRQSAKGEVMPLNFVVVRDDEENGGVIEVARLNQPADAWTQEKDRLTGVAYLKSRDVEIQAPAGTYRVEVNTPDNIGTYMLTIGEDEVSHGYFATLGNIRETQKHFGYSIFRMLFVPHVYYALGVIIILTGIYYTHRRRKSLTHGS